MKGNPIDGNDTLIFYQEKTWGIEEKEKKKFGWMINLISILF
jgi:hypothetical protein